MKINFLLAMVNYTYTVTHLLSIIVLFQFLQQLLKIKPRVPLKLLSNILLLDVIQGLVLNLSIYLLEMISLNKCYRNM